MALKRAAMEAFEGQYTETRLEGKMDPEGVKERAFQRIQEALSQIKFKSEAKHTTDG